MMGAALPMSSGRALGGRRQMAILAVALAPLAVVGIRLLIALTLHVWSLSVGRNGFSPLDFGGDDGVFYYQAASEVADGGAPYLPNVYPAAVGLVMRATGVREILFFKLLNVAAGIGACAVAVGLLARLRRASVGGNTVDHRGTAIVLLLCGLYPSAIFYTSLSLYRDAWIFLAHLAAVAFAFEAATRRGARRVVHLAALAAALYILFLLRWYAAVSVVLGTAAWLLVPFGAHVRGAQRWLRISGLAAIGLAITVTAVTTPLLASGREDYDAIVEYRTGFETKDAGTTMGIEVRGQPAYLVPPVYLYSVVSNALGPLPWQIKSRKVVLIALAEGPIMLAVLVGIWRRRRRLDATALFLVFQVIVWFGLIGYSNDNIGTATRLRVLGWNLLFVLYAFLRCRPSALRRRVLATS